MLSAAAPALNTWTPLVAVYDARAGQLCLYVDGVRQGSPVAATSWASTGRFHVGRSGTGARFSGALDEARVYASALSPAAVTALAAGRAVMWVGSPGLDVRRASGNSSARRGWLWRTRTVAWG
ncbi:LamG-like jellyroll fold domain-containing protein [Actinoplanes utahensis]|uniref:LamG-like jellyroll fold domain-containing protein n=1 Tax=Actinoplanes utahensis TaxID=1869 RepID=A0A0A6UDN9_ACTUT|nr:LamG-like jellyroll fold domain-containing protein [Actinoplanes utahensis]KHD74155.1 hypothetical protein MB27_30460 [Actinoplanes utahensis]GIF31691.1 hypothetical protein Aut01nite_46770 [Actinoplanes utahensis]